MSELYLSLLPTPGGDKYHLFTVAPGQVTITNDMGPTAGIEVAATETGVFCKMPAGMTTHTFRLDFAAMTVENCVIDNQSGKQLQSQTVAIQAVDSDVLPENPPAPEGMGGPGGPPPARA